MYTIRRKLAAVLAGVMAVPMLLSACGGGSATSQSSQAAESTTPAASTTESAAEAPAAESLEEVTLHFYFFDGKKSLTDKVWDEISAKYKEQLNAKFDIQFIAGTDYKDKMLVKISAGDKWDLNFEGDWVSYFQMINKDAYLPLDDLLPVYAPDLYAAYQDSGVLESAKSKGKVVALPWTMVMNQRPFLQWRGDLAASAGIEVDKASIKDIESVDALLYKLKEAYPDKFTIENAGTEVFNAKTT